MERRDMVQRDADRIRKIILIGSDCGKRKIYFEKAVLEAGLCLSFYDWKDYQSIEEHEDLKSCIVKIDAPEWESCRLEELESLTRQYRERLYALSRLPFGAFFNHPDDIAELLDKQKCKKKLVENEVAVTKMYDETFSCKEELLCFMRENRIHQVFIKPVKGSGAAGVAALRFLPIKGRLAQGRLAQGKLALYTCAAIDKGEIVNTKRMYRLEGKDAAVFLDKLLKLECIVEKWHTKSTYQGYCYDLRVIVQNNRIDYILPRLSKGPITNLHLNNHSMDFEKLNLDKAVTEDISRVCTRAAKCYPGLKSIGMDVLLEKESQKPYIIEMNAQGDLLHRDVYHENRIYNRQVEIIKEIMALETEHYE